MIARDVRKNESQCGCSTPKNLKPIMTLRVLANDHFEEVGTEGAQHDEGAVLPSLGNGGAERQCLRSCARQFATRFSPSDHFFCAVQILDAVGMWTKDKESLKASCGKNSSGLGGCQVERQCDARTFEGGPGPSSSARICRQRHQVLERRDRHLRREPGVPRRRQRMGYWWHCTSQ